MIFFNKRQLRRALMQYVEHYHTERNHQGLKNQSIDPGEEVGAESGEISFRERLGGMLKHYFRDAA